MVSSKLKDMAKKEVKISSRSKGKDEEFLNELLIFYQSSMKGLIGSVKQIAKVQKDYPKQYVIFKQLNKEPSLLIELGKGLSDKEKAILFELLIKSESLSKKMNVLFELSYEEKNILAKEIESFSKELIKIIDDLKKTKK